MIAPREDVAEQIAQAIEAEYLCDDTGVREDEAYDDAIRLAARIARSFAAPSKAADR